MTGSRRNSRMAPYFVQMRELERNLIRSALDAAGGTVAGAAAILGVHYQYLKVRGTLLGGVFGNEPKHEPPGSALDVWNRTHNNLDPIEDAGRKPRARKKKTDA